MSIRSLLVCSFLLAAALAGSIKKMPSDSASSKEANITEKERDRILEEIDYLRNQYVDIRDNVNNWMEDPYHRNVVAPAAIGAFSALVTMIILCILFCWCKRCISKRIAYRKLNETGSGWFGRQKATHDS